MDPSCATAPEVLVSCILPTRNRAAYIGQAVRSYQSQTYLHKELIIVDNGSDGTEALIPSDPTIHYARVGGTHSTGEMRNLCARRAQGTYICHFDSDDWSAPTRITDQITRLGAQGVVTGYRSMYFYDDRDGLSYLWTTSLGMFALGTSFCYQRAWWQQHPFLPIQIGEDFRFFKTATRGTPWVTSTPINGQMVARIHVGQTSRKNLASDRYKQIPGTVLPREFPRAL
jgi:Glycosyltransferases involved in cell wall biogenesis